MQEMQENTLKTSLPVGKTDLNFWQLFTARMLILRGRPPGRAAGNLGAISAQPASDKSVS